MRERHLRENFAALNRLALSLLKQHPGRQGVATTHAEESGIKAIHLPGDGPDLDPIERLRDGTGRVKRSRWGHRLDGLATLRAACQWFITTIDANPGDVVDRPWPKLELDPEPEAKILVSA